MRKAIVIILVMFAVWGTVEFVEGLAALKELAMPGGSGTKRLQEFRESLRKEASLASLSPAARSAGVPRPRGEDGSAPDAATSGSTYFPIQTSREAADIYFNEHRAQWNIQDYHTLKPEFFESPLGTKVKYSVFQDGVPVVGLAIELDIGQDRRVTAAENTYLPVKKVDMNQPFLSHEEVIARQAGRYTLDESSTAGVSRILYLAPGNDEPELSYVIPVHEAATKTAVSVIFRATDGQVLGKQAGRAEFGR